MGKYRKEVDTWFDLYGAAGKSSLLIIAEHAEGEIAALEAGARELSGELNYFQRLLINKDQQYAALLARVEAHNKKIQSYIDRNMVQDKDAFAGYLINTGEGEG